MHESVESVDLRLAARNESYGALVWRRLVGS